MGVQHGSAVVLVLERAVESAGGLIKPQRAGPLGELVTQQIWWGETLHF